MIKHWETSQWVMYPTGRSSTVCWVSGRVTHDNSNSEQVQNGSVGPVQKASYFYEGGAGQNGVYQVAMSHTAHATSTDARLFSHLFPHLGPLAVPMASSKATRMAMSMAMGTLRFSQSLACSTIVLFLNRAISFPASPMVMVTLTPTLFTLWESALSPMIIRTASHTPLMSPLPAPMADRRSLGEVSPKASRAMASAPLRPPLSPLTPPRVIRSRALCSALLHR